MSCDDDPEDPADPMPEPTAPPAAHERRVTPTARRDESAEQLMLRFRRGEVRAFAQIVARYKRPIVAFLYRMTGDRHWAEDLAQDVFVRVFGAADTYREGRPFTPWLYAIARNIAIDFLRRPFRRREAARPDAPEERSDPRDPEALALVREREAAVRDAIAGLPEIYREAVVLCDMQGLSYRDAAEAAEITVKTISSRLARGRAMLAERLRPMLSTGADDEERRRG